jgi:Hemerythrin HHE cation binding domain
LEGEKQMSGPSLKKPDAHSSIHEAALNEAKELRDIFQRCLEDGQKEKALQVAEVIIEHWETRTLKHAESEEEGLYKEMVEENPELKDLVVQLTRDHDIMRRIIQQMKEMLYKQEVDEEFTALMDAVIIVDLIHNEDEMNKLLPNNKH